MTKSRMLLLGGGGFIGTHLAKQLRHAGHDVIVTSRTARADCDLTPSALSAVGTILQLVVERKIGTVVHLVSGLLPASNQHDFFNERETVIGPTCQLAGLLAERGVALVFLSSGGTVYGVPSNSCAAEEDPCRPISFYGQSKLEIEQYLSFLARTRGLRHLIVRPSNPYGIGQALNRGQGLISVLLDRIRSGQPLKVWGDGSSVRDYIYISDMVEALVGLIESGISNAIFNLGSGVGHSLLEVVQTVEQVTGRSIELEFHPPRAVDVPRLVLDVSRLKAAGFHRARPLSQGIQAHCASLGYWA